MCTAADNPCGSPGRGTACSHFAHGETEAQNQCVTGPEATWRIPLRRVFLALSFANKSLTLSQHIGLDHFLSSHFNSSGLVMDPFACRQVSFMLPVI